VSRDELRRETERLPQSLREQFDSPAGRRELLASIVDKRLLVQEARRREFQDDPEIHRQVRELEERLIVQKLLGEDERAAGPATGPELRSYYEAHKSELAQKDHQVPSFEQTKSFIEGKVTAQRKRKAFDDLLGRLRRAADVHLEEAPRL
jgi:peptidyl-prolyl cis-trans isomerase C